MTSNAVAGFGALFTWNSADIAELTSISGPSESMSPIDITNHDSPDAFREFVAGILDGGEVSIEGNFIKGDTAGQIAMHTDFQAGTMRAWIVKMPGWAGGNPQVAGNGYLTAFAISYPFEDKVSFTATVKVTGKPVMTLS